jgi:pilus assembly protein CpaB
MNLPLNTIKPNKTWLVLGLALGIGLLAALGTRMFLSRQMEAIEAKKGGAGVKVVVAKMGLKRGDVVSSDTVAVREVPADYAHSSALMPQEIDRFEGSKLAYPVNPGELILWSMLESKKPPSFSTRVEAGRRAMTLPVDEINSISGMLEPGDLVDLMVNIDQRGKKFTFPLVQRIRVMATGQRLVDDPKSGERRQYSTVTLDATPEEAQNLIMAREAGKITALLRNPTDKEEIHARHHDLTSVLGLDKEDRPPSVVPASVQVQVVPRQVPVLYGGAGGKLVPESLQLGRKAPTHDAVPASTPSLH